MYFKKWSIILVVFWMGIIFVMSHLDGSKSWILTGELLTIIKTDSFDFESTLDEKLESYEVKSTWNKMAFLRKTAHFVEYFILGALLMNALLFRLTRVKASKVAFLTGFIFAVLDEIHQLFIPKRTGRIMDVIIDMSGVLVALLFLEVIRKVRKANTNEN